MKKIMLAICLVVVMIIAGCGRKPNNFIRMDIDGDGHNDLVMKWSE